MSIVQTNMSKSISILRLLAELGLLVGLAFFASKMFWNIVAPPQFSSQASLGNSATQTAYANNSARYIDLSLLINQNPFLPRDRAVGGVNSAALDAPETNLNLTLKGLRANGDGAGVAFILLPDNTQIRAGVGTEILNNVKVEYVFGDRITLRTQGQLETLYLRDLNGQTTSVIKSTGAPVVREAENTQPPKQQATPQTSAISPSVFVRNISLSLVRENGVRTGYRLTPKNNADTLQAAGFQSGDIIRRVNSRSVSEINNEELQELLLRSANAVFEVERAGEAVRVSVEFAKGTQK